MEELTNVEMDSCPNLYVASFVSKRAVLFESGKSAFYLCYVLSSSAQSSIQSAPKISTRKVDLKEEKRCSTVHWKWRMDEIDEAGPVVRRDEREEAGAFTRVIEEMLTMGLGRWGGGNEEKRWRGHVECREGRKTE